MVTIKMLKPYHIKVDSKYIHLILSYQDFTVFINEEEYQFVPTEAKEIRINRRTKQIENPDAKFAFQKCNVIKYITMTELIFLTDFLIQLNSIVKTYYYEPIVENKNDKNYNSEIIIDELEQLNKRRLIDKALDERDEEAFYALLKLL